MFIEKGYVVKSVVIRSFSAFFVLFLGIILLLFHPFRVHADGGAPNLAYVAGTSQGVSAVDVAQQKVTNTLSVNGDPSTILLSVDGRLLYVTQPALGQVSVIAPKNKQVVCTRGLPGHPSLLALDPGQDVLYVAGNEANSITALNPTTCAVLRTLHISGPVYGLVVAVVGSGISGGSGNQIWVASAHSLTVFDADGKQRATVSLSEDPRYLSIPAAGTVYATTRQGSVLAVDINTHHVSQSLLTGGTFGPMDYDATTGEVYVPDQQHNVVNVLAPLDVGATPPHEPRRTLHFDAAPQSIAITSDGQLGFAALNNGTVAMLDIPGRKTINTINVGGHPHFIITGLYPSLFSLTPQQSTLLGILSNLSHYVAALVIVIITIIVVRLPRQQKPPSPKAPVERKINP